jgi:integrase/recombinase XerD
MLASLFPVAHKRHARSPVAAWLVGFAGWLVEVGYGRQPSCGHVRRLREVLESQVPAVPADAVFSEEGLAALFASASARAPKRRCALRATWRAFARYLRERLPEQLIVEPEAGAHAELVSAYGRYLIEVRGLKPITAAQHVATARAFLAAAVPTGGLIGEVTREAVEDFVIAASRRIKRQSLQHTVARLRAFLRYCFVRGLMAEHLDQIDTPRTYRDELPPRALPWPLVQALLDSIDRSSKGGYRDHAMLHLMAHYGLRPSEIVALTVGAIDRQARTLEVEQRKTQSRLTLPISAATVRVLDEYLALGRPPSRERALFLRLRSPAGPIRHYALCDVYRKRARESGLPLAGSSSYALRHGFAMRLLEGGVTVKTIGDLLGHRTLEATSVYLRLQTEALRHVALPVPTDITSVLGVRA